MAKIDELGFDLDTAVSWFPSVSKPNYFLVEVEDSVASALRAVIAAPLRRCYISDRLLADRVAATALTSSEVVAAVLPPRGSVMSGDFGEILAALAQATNGLPEKVLEPKKWRLKGDRTKAAPYVDVIQFVLPTWPTPSASDRLLSAEVKSKATPGNFRPIEKAIADLSGDRLSRVAKTLAWIRDRAVVLGLDGTVQLGHIERFINAAEHPPAERAYRAVAVIDRDLVDVELRESAASLAASTVDVYVMSVPDLKDMYEEAFDSARDSGFL